MAFLQGYLAHARTFGVTGVMLTAIEEGYETEELVELLIELDSIEAVQLNDKKKRRELGLVGIVPSYRHTPEERVERMVADAKK